MSSVHVGLPANIVALLEGFLIVTKTLNISQAARELKISRITLQNRLRELEKLCGYKLLELDGHNTYKLTARAQNWAEEVRIWLRRGEDIFSLSDERAKGLLQSSFEHYGKPFFSQQHPVNDIWEHDTPYLQSMLSDWVKAKAEFGNPKLARLSDNAFFVRLRDEEFIIMAIGKHAAIMEWLGREWCLSAIGKPLSSTAISTRADQIVTYAYRQAILTGSPWYDHVSVAMPRPVKNSIERAYYRRLILPCKLPDGSPVVASIVELTTDLKIHNFKVPYSD
jgi:hypothetical protein